MKTQSGPLDFLDKSQTDQQVSDRVLAAFERGANLAADEVIKIARQLGYTFDRKQFEQEVLRSMEERFAAGERQLAYVIGNPQLAGAPESACSRGCLSYSVNYHPKPH